jgi:hypothetical protein
MRTQHIAILLKRICHYSKKWCNEDLSKDLFHSTAYVSKALIPTAIFICCTAFLMLSCKKTDNNPVVSGNTTVISHTGKMAGTRHWRAYRYHNYNGTDDTTYVNLDTSFAVIVIDQNKIKFLGEVFTYESTKSTDSIFVFYDLGSTTYSPSLAYGTTIVYYPANDSIVYYYKSKVLNHFDYYNYYSP